MNLGLCQKCPCYQVEACVDCPQLIEVPGIFNGQPAQVCAGKYPYFCKPWDCLEAKGKTPGWLPTYVNKQKVVEGG